MSSEVVKMPVGTVTFETAAGAKFEVPVLTLEQDLRDLSAKVRDEGRTHLDFLSAVIDLCRERFGIELSIEEADWFKDELGVVFAKKKQRQLKSIEDRLNSVYSMGSTVSDSAPSSSTP